MRVWGRCGGWFGEGQKFKYFITCNTEVVDIPDKHEDEDILPINRPYLLY